MNNRLKLYPPAIELEFVRGCNLRCDFCANVSLPKQVEFMSVKTLMNVCQGLVSFRYYTKSLRMSIAGRGEPFMHPKIFDFIRTIIEETSIVGLRMQITVFTNGTLLDSNKINSFFMAGGNILIVDCYNKTTRYKVKEAICKCNNVLVFEEDEFNPFKKYSNRLRVMVLFSDIGLQLDKKRKLYGRCNNISDEACKKYNIKRITEPLHKKCIKPFRHLMIHYDGIVPLCCMDWNRKVIMNDIKLANLSEYWFGNENLLNIRRMLYRGNRNLYPCKLCDYDGGSYQGLIPNL